MGGEGGESSRSYRPSKNFSAVGIWPTSKQTGGSFKKKKKSMKWAEFISPLSHHLRFQNKVWQNQGRLLVQHGANCLTSPRRETLHMSR